MVKNLSNEQTKNAKKPNIFQYNVRIFSIYTQLNLRANIANL